ncbi:MAG: sensor histidine kinase [Bacteroidota bacterium]
MNIRKLHQLIPFEKLFKLLVLFSVTLQVIIISYNHLSGFFHLTGIRDFLARLIFSSVLTTIAAFLIAYPDLFIIQYLNRSFSWSKRIIGRVIIQIISTVIIGIAVSTFITLFAHWLDSYEEDLVAVLISNAMVASVVNFILVIILEAWIFFNESKQAKIKADDLEKELSQIKFEVLKSQINPHFMFNSLNVLSGLIDEDVNKAQQFLDEFSLIYRYVLESIDKTVVTLSEELSFARSYIYLQQMRYGENLIFDVNIPADLLQRYMPPLSLQVILENATKHNIVSDSQPLKIEIYNDQDWLIVRNNIQSKLSRGQSTGLGQKNLVKRYGMIGNETPKFLVETNHYVVKLPIIKNENDESINC